MLIEYLNVRITPSLYASRKNVTHEVQIKVKVFGSEEYTLNEIMPEDDLTSHFQRYMHSAQRTIVDAIKALEEEAADAVKEDT